MKYEWRDNFSNIEHVLPKGFVEKVFKRLNEGTSYYDDKGKFMGKIIAIDGPLSVIHIISDHSLEYGKYPLIDIKITYIGKTALYLRMFNDGLSVYEFNNGWWANKL